MEVAMEMKEYIDSLSCEDSFVVLRRDSLPCDIEDGDVLISQNLSDNSNSTTGSNVNVVTLSPKFEESADVDEIPLKLNQLISENILLKESLNQCNLSMKNQLETLIKWHQEIVETHETHKQKFLDSQEKILKLMEENDNLKKLLEDKKDCNNLDEFFKEAAVDLGDALTEELKEMLELPQCDNTGLMRKIVELTIKNNQLEKSLSTIKSEKLGLELMLEEYEEQMGVTRQDLESKSHSKSAKDQGEKNRTSGEDKLSGETGTNSFELNSLHPSISIINAEISDCGNKADGLRKETLVQSPNENCDEMAELKAQNKALLAEKGDLQREIDRQNDLIDDLKKYTENLKTELNEKENVLGSKVEEIKKLEGEKESLIQQCNEVEVYKIMASIYENDFNEERRMREEAVTEKEQMAETVRIQKNMLSNYEANFSQNPRGNGEESGPFFCHICGFNTRNEADYRSHCRACTTINNFD